MAMLTSVFPIRSGAEFLVGVDLVEEVRKESGSVSLRLAELFGLKEKGANPLFSVSISNVGASRRNI